MLHGHAAAVLHEGYIARQLLSTECRVSHFI